MSSADLPFISLFSGAGGLDIGLEQAGWSCVYAADADAAATRTLMQNRGFNLGRGVHAFSEAFIEQSDVRFASPEDMLSKAGKRRGDVPLLVGGPPCQSWSSAGHQRGFEDPRGRLFEDFVRLAAGLGVRWLLLENVRGLLTARGPDGEPGSALAYVRGLLLKAGFQTAVSLFNAADYGVPQRRVRLFLVGFRAGDPPPFPKPSHSRQADPLDDSKLPWITLGNALTHMPPVEAYEILRPSERLAEELCKLKPGQGVKSPGKREVTRPGGHWGYKQGAFVADLDHSARTVTANAQQDWIIDFKLGLRRLCPRECATLQGFPRGWHFDGKAAVQYRLIGNAVPPPLARAFGRALKRHVNRHAKTEATEFGSLLPLPPSLLSAIRYTMRDERANGESRRAVSSRRILRAMSAELP